MKQRQTRRRLRAPGSVSGRPVATNPSNERALARTRREARERSGGGSGGRPRRSSQQRSPKPRSCAANSAQRCVCLALRRTPGDTPPSPEGLARQGDTHIHSPAHRAQLGALPQIWGRVGGRPAHRAQLGGRAGVCNALCNRGVQLHRRLHTRCTPGRFRTVARARRRCAAARRRGRYSPG